MQALLMNGLLTLLPLAAVGYAQFRLSRDTANPRERWLVRVGLLLLALAFGFTMMRLYPDTSRWQRGVIFLSSFGVTHVPAAVILLLKHWQRAGR